MGSFYMEATQINYRRDETLKTVDQKLQELSETSAIDTDIAPVFKSTNTYAPGDMVYYRNKLYVFNVEHTGAWAAGDVTATDVTTEISSLKSGLTNKQDTLPIKFIKGTADPQDNTTYIFDTTVSALSLFIFFGQGTGSAGDNGKNYIFTVASNYGNTELTIAKIAGDYDISGFTVTKTATGFTINTGSGFSRTFFCVKLS